VICPGCKISNYQHQVFRKYSGCRDSEIQFCVFRNSSGYKISDVWYSRNVQATLSLRTNNKNCRNIHFIRIVRICSIQGISMLYGNPHWIFREYPDYKVSENHCWTFRECVRGRRITAGDYIRYIVRAYPGHKDNENQHQIFREHPGYRVIDIQHWLLRECPGCKLSEN